MKTPNYRPGSAIEFTIFNTTHGTMFNDRVAAYFFAAYRLGFAKRNVVSRFIRNWRIKGAADRNRLLNGGEQIRTLSLMQFHSI